NSVYVLPAGDATLEDFHWVLREITAEGGEGSVCRASFVDGLTDAEVEELFRRARSSDYDEIADAALAALKALPRVPDADERTRARAELARLQRRIADMSAVDFFGAPARAKVDDLMGRL